MKLLDQILFIYTLFFCLVLVGGNLTNLDSMASLVSLILFIPVIGYLGYQCITMIYARKYGLASDASNSNHDTHDVQKSIAKPKATYNLHTLFTQGGVSLVLSLFLLATCALTLITQSVLNRRYSQFISPISNSLTLATPSDQIK